MSPHHLQVLDGALNDVNFELAAHGHLLSRCRSGLRRVRRFWMRLALNGLSAMVIRAIFREVGRTEGIIVARARSQKWDSVV
jgi:hypothetical protein